MTRTRQPGRHRRPPAGGAAVAPRPGLLAAGVRGLLTSVAAAVAALAAWVLLPLLWGWNSYTVTTGSMTPLVRPGDVVVASGAGHDVAVGTVVVLSPPPERTEPVTHRVVEHLPDGRYRTKGDANPQPDTRLVTDDQIVGRVQVVVPLAGQIKLQLGRGGPVLGIVVIVAALALPLFRSRPARPARAARRGAPVVAGLVVLSIAAVTATWSATRSGWTRTAAAPSSSFTTSDFYYPAMVASGPVSYWRLGGGDSTSAPDAMGVAPLTLVNTPLVNQPGALRGDPDTAMGFRRTPAVSYATVSNTQHQFASTMTVAAWVRTIGTVNTTWRLVFKGVTSNLNYLLSWNAAGTDMRFLVDLASGARLTAMGPWPTDGGWHFVVGVYDNTAARLYLDGVEKTPQAGTGALKTSTAALTVSEPSGGIPLNGDVDEVALWSRALSAAEISRLYSIGKR